VKTRAELSLCCQLQHETIETLALFQILEGSASIEVCFCDRRLWLLSCILYCTGAELRLLTLQIDRAPCRNSHPLTIRRHAAPMHYAIH